MPTQIGTRSFVGNGAYVPDGTHLPDGVLIGVQSTVPDQARLQPGQTWFGAPPISLPVREQLTGFGEAQTFRPSLARRLARGLIEGLRIVLPLALTTILEEHGRVFDFQLVQTGTAALRLDLGAVHDAVATARARAAADPTHD